MRLIWTGVLVFSLISISGSVSAGQTLQSAANPVSDPQAVATVNAAITALGGTTSIDQAQTWAFEAQLDGPMESGSKSETISLQIPSATIVVNGVTRRVGRLVRPSLFLPVLVGAILRQESQDPRFVMVFDGPSTIASRSVNVVNFLDSTTRAIAQVWAFDAATTLPTRAVFEMEAQIGLAKSFRGLVDFSNYVSVSGVLHPFTVTTYIEGKEPQTLNLKSVTPSTSQVLTSGGQQ
jgi:hypothetical protein